MTCNSGNPFETISYDFCRHVISKNISVSENALKIICLSEDNLLLAAQLRDEFNIPGMRFEQAQSFRDKTIMKYILQKNQIRTPHYVKFDHTRINDPKNYYDHLTQTIGLPFVLKPFNLLGGLGIVMVKSFEEFNSFCIENAKELSYEYEAEEFISGTLFHCDSIIENSEILFSTCCEYTNPNITSQHEMKWTVKEGDQIKSSMSLRDKAASITAWNNNYEELRKDFLFLKDYQSIAVH